MYDAPREWECWMLDWHQFGYMVAHCICDFKDYHNVQVLEHLKEDEFTSNLIGRGIAYLLLTVHTITVCCSTITQVCI